MEGWGYGGWREEGREGGRMKGWRDGEMEDEGMEGGRENGGMEDGE